MMRFGTMRLHKSYVLWLVALVVIAIGFATVFIPFFDQSEFILADNIQIANNNLIIGNNCTAIVGSISAERGLYIEQGINDITADRPNIYDVFKDTIAHFNITLKDVYITHIEDGSFISKSTFVQKDKILLMDARPSDMVALALRTKSPIYINKTLLEEYGENVC